ncbi:MAG: phosphoenolpyruvate--protein phosphotransferase [Victivallales bacterium]|nr:phosphoenolpyruvate--protein phosphotransferase [Victivallales bacterium]
MEGGKPRLLHGIGVTTGTVVGKCWVRLMHEIVLPERQITPEQIPSEWKRLEEALGLSRGQLEDLYENVRQMMGDDKAEIIEFHLMMLDDEELLQNIRTILEQELCCIEQAVDHAIAAACTTMQSKADPYFQERAEDIRDVGNRILRNLLGEPVGGIQYSPKEPSVLLTDDLTPTETAHLDLNIVKAIVTRGGSRTSHTAILARALGIPAIVAVQETLDGLADGMEVALDVSRGVVIVNPDEATAAAYRAREEKQKALLAQMLDENRLCPETRDGFQARLVANVELPHEAEQAKRRYNVGVGLFRTEFLFITKGRPLSEEEQFENYRQTAEAVYPRSVIFRTLDIGGDKVLSQLDMPQELNPFMGTRAIRFSLYRPELFKEQLRAILRASAYGKVRVMFPMISTQEELVHAIKYLDEVKLELSRDNIPFNDELDVGCMIEVPSAALLAERLAPMVDFFSIGTNDLVQYSLAVDRGNPAIAYLYQPAHPAVLRQMKHVVDAAYASGKWVSVCGEMAAELLYTPLILGMGIHELSMSPMSLPSVHQLISNIRMQDAEILVAQALECNDGLEVDALCRNFLQRACPEILTGDDLPPLP